MNVNYECDTENNKYNIIETIIFIFVTLNPLLFLPKMQLYDY